eukprot:8409804-Heterocapsa_arctica.AAC.1
MEESREAEQRRREEYPPDQHERPEKHAYEVLKCCETCGMNFMTVPIGWSGYIHKNCCSKCTGSGGQWHSKRCREKTKYMKMCINPVRYPYPNHWQGGSAGSKDATGWWHQGWQQQGWSTQGWTRPGQEQPEDNDGSQGWQQQGWPMQDWTRTAQEEPEGNDGSQEEPGYYYEEDKITKEE